MKREEMIKEAIRKGETWCYKSVRSPLLTEEDIESHKAYFGEHIAEKNKEVNTAIAEIKNLEAFAFFSDAHVDGNSFSAVHIIRSVLANTPVKTVLYAGDTVGGYGNGEEMCEDVIHFNKMYSFADLYPARGNHDIYAKPFEYADIGYILPNSEVYNYIFKDIQHKVNGIEGKTYYWFEHENTKVRYIVVDTNEKIIVGYHETGIWDLLVVNVTNEQLDWFRDTLMSTPEDYRIIVMGHIPVNEHMAWSNPICQTFSQIIEAYNNREKKRCFALYENIEKKLFDAYGGEIHNEIEVDFTEAESKVVMYICGHGHTDDLYVSDSGCAYYEIHTDSMCDNGGSIYRKTRGTVTESVVDVILYDRDSGMIRNIRYGAGKDDILREADTSNK